MSLAILEHVNVTVNDSRVTAQRLVDLFDWKIRWQGPSMDGQGHTVHVGGDDYYLAVYSPVKGASISSANNYTERASLNHIGVVVPDIDAMEARVKSAGYSPTNHGDYEPGKRFYFDDEDGIEFEIVSYG